MSKVCDKTKKTIFSKIVDFDNFSHIKGTKKYKKKYVCYKKFMNWKEFDKCCSVSVTNEVR